jgi:hypothetical protein
MKPHNPDSVPVRVVKSIGLGAMMLLLVGLFSGYPGMNSAFLHSQIAPFLFIGIKPVLLNSSIFNDSCAGSHSVGNCTEIVEEDLALIGMFHVSSRILIRFSFFLFFFSFFFVLFPFPFFFAYLLASITFAALNIGGFFTGLLCDVLGNRNMALTGVIVWMV